MAEEIIEHFQTAERDYTVTRTRFIKRELKPSEYHKRQFGNFGTIVPQRVRERLENEKDAYRFVAEYTKIPVPKVLDFLEEDGICTLIVERVEGNIMEIVLDELDGEDRKRLIHNVTAFVEQSVLPQLRKFTSNRLGGVSGLVIPPNRVTFRDQRPEWRSRTFSENQFTFCHNDLARHNIMVNPKTLEVTAIIDWESSGFYPAEFEADMWLRSYRDYVPDEASTDRLIRLLDQPSAENFPVTMIDIPDGVIYMWQTEDRDRHCTLTPSTFTKRQLRPYEKSLGVQGTITPFPWSRERLENEKKALEFIAEHTSIPVARVHAFNEEAGISSLTTKIPVPGARMDILARRLSNRDKAILLTHVNTFVNQTVLPQLNTLQSSKLGGIIGMTIPPIRVWKRDKRLSWPARTSNTNRYVFCHNEISQEYIWVDPKTLQVVLLQNWECSGYYPPEFEYPYWRKARDEWMNNDDEVDRLILFLDKPDEQPLVKGPWMARTILWGMISSLFYWIKNKGFGAIYILFSGSQLRDSSSSKSGSSSV